MTGFSDYECEHALREWLSKGRVCALDGLICHNYDKPELVAKCPAIKALRRGRRSPTQTSALHLNSPPPSPMAPQMGDGRIDGL